MREKEEICKQCKTSGHTPPKYCISTGQGPFRGIVHHYHESRQHNVIDFISDEVFMDQEKAIKAAEAWLREKGLRTEEICKDEEHDLVRPWAWNAVERWAETGGIAHSEAAIRWSERTYRELGMPASVYELRIMLRLSFEAGRVYERELTPKRELLPNRYG